MSGVQPSAAAPPVTIARDNGPIHASQAPGAAPADCKPWPTPERMAKYAQDLNAIERDRKTLKAQHLAQNLRDQG
ncbi:MAG: hypothetical protein ACREDA_05010 [Methylocella sp.]